MKRTLVLTLHVSDKLSDYRTELGEKLQNSNRETDDLIKLPTENKNQESIIQD